MKVLVAHKIVRGPIAGGGVVNTLNLLNHLEKRGIEAEHLNFKTRRWWIYILLLFLTLPFKRIPPDTIIHTFRLDNMLPFIIWKRSNPKVVMTDHHITTMKGPIAKLIYSLFEPFILKRIDVLATNTQSALEYTYWRADYGKLVVLPMGTSGVDLERFKPNGSKYDVNTIIFIGQMIKRKDPAFAVEVMKHLNAEQYRLICIGGGPELAKITNMGVEITALGFVSHDSARYYETLASSHILILCSDWEGSPTVVKEALACGLPVVSNDVGDVRNMLQEPLTGRIVKKTPEAYVKAIKQTLSQPRAKVETACRQVASNYSTQILGDKLIAEYRELGEHSYIDNERWIHSRVYVQFSDQTIYAVPRDTAYHKNMSPTDWAKWVKENGEKID